GEQAAAADGVVGKAETLRRQAEANPVVVSRWRIGLAAVEQAEAVRDEAARPRLLALRTAIEAGADTARRDRALLDRLVDIRSSNADDHDRNITDAAYTTAIRASGNPPAKRAPASGGDET